MFSFFIFPQELRFIFGSIPIFNLSAAIAASRMYVWIFDFYSCQNFSYHILFKGGL